MNAPSLSTPVRQPHALDADALLEPVPGDARAGISLRYDPVYQAIRAARHQDDPSLPMGDWERPLQKADWKQAAALCANALATRSKDFQLAGWLCEAWTHLHGIEGFAAGARVIAALAEQYWDDAYPAIDDGDTEARASPFAWINETLPAGLALHVPLVRVDSDAVADATLDTWERAMQGRGSHGLTREDLLASAAESGNRARLAHLHRHLPDAMAAWTALDQAIDARLGNDAPSLARVTETLARLSRAVAALLGADLPPQELDAMDLEARPVTMDSDGQAADVGTGAPAWDEPMASGATATTAQAQAGGIASRAQAYRLLQEVADYLARTEPHSPTPYLLRRAVGWGQMPLDALMRDILRDEGDVMRYLALLEQQ
jgi:type VI secretion system protein ImpA